jgi:hypothetical protein
VVTVNLIALPTVAVTVLPEVMAGAWSTTRRKLCVADPAALVAFTVRRRLPPVPAAGVPAKVAVPFELAVKLSPVGSAPDSVRLAVGLPVAVTVKVRAWPTVKVTVAAEVMAGVWSTKRTKVCAVDPAELVAFTVS